jgi:Tfp pilus assembly pilus retraction ATPase PilT
LRHIPIDIPPFAALGLPAVLHSFIQHRQDLILVTGSNGMGKSTTLTAPIGHVNQAKKTYIITLEDPIEFSHPSKQSQGSQRKMPIHEVLWERDSTTRILTRADFHA